MTTRKDQTGGSGWALLVDGDNVSPELLRPLVARLEGDGKVPERRVFRNWRSRKGAQEWDDLSKELAFERIDRYSTRRGKNAADIALVVDAMDLLHAGYDRFCIASGDTDFVPLIERLRRGGGYVVIVGHKSDGGLLAQVSDEYLAGKSLRSVPTGGRKGGGRGERRGGAAAKAPARGGRSGQGGRQPQKRQGDGAAQKRQQGGGGPQKRQGGGSQRQQQQAQGGRQGGQGGSQAAKQDGGPTRGQRDKLGRVLQSAYDACEAEGQADDEGWVRVDVLGKMVRVKDQSFAPQNYGLPGNTSLSDAFKEFKQYQVRKEMKGKRPQYSVRRR